MEDPKFVRCLFHVFVILLVYILGKWFVSTGKDNLLNAWRTPYGASIFQVRMILLLMKKNKTCRVPRVDSDIFIYVIYPKWDAEMRVTDFFLMMKNISIFLLVQRIFISA